MNLRQYPYVGPDEIRRHALVEIHRTHIGNADDLRQWLTAAEPNARRRDYVPATFVVDASGQLWIADRRSEHVACAAGGEVLAAGELVFCQTGSAVDVIEATNQSTGYCPEPESRSAAAAALDGAGITRPPKLTTTFEFRRCGGCGSTNLIKDAVFECSVCGAELSSLWNYAEGA